MQPDKTAPVIRINQLNIHFPAVKIIYELNLNLLLNLKPWLLTTQHIIIFW